MTMLMGFDPRYSMVGQLTSVMFTKHFSFLPCRLRLPRTCITNTTTPAEYPLPQFGSMGAKVTNLGYFSKFLVQKLSFKLAQMFGDFWVF